MEFKQVIVLRKDLNMRKGKMVAQGCHASNGSLLMNAVINHEQLIIPMTPALYAWLSGNYKKVCLGADSEDHLLSLYSRAKECNLPCVLIQDSGLTEFKGVPTYTSIAIGPEDDVKIDKIIGGLSLL